MQFNVLASGSDGNAAVATSNKETILIDAGISARSITEGLHNLGTAPENLNGIFLTHSHSDHTAGLRCFLKKTGAPVFATQGTIDSIFTHLSENEKKAFSDRFFSLEDSVERFSEIEIEPVFTYHDAIGSCGYKISDGRSQIGILTDTGHTDLRMVEVMRKVDLLLLEFNHEPKMLESNPHYPFPLKRRILSDYGHLSNEAAGEFLKEMINPELKVLLLGHLSKENNYPELALRTARNAIRELPSQKVRDDLRLIVLEHLKASEVFTL